MDMPNLQQIKQLMNGINFPISKEELVNRLSEKGADEKITGFIQKLPKDNFDSPKDVLDAANPMD